MMRLCLVLLVGLLWPPGLRAQAVEQPLVLVASVHSTIRQLSADETRKLYLGMPLIVGGQRVRPLRNANPKVQEMFMQKVMFMSTPAYERHILSRVFRMGGSRPPVYVELRELLAALEQDPAAVTYLPRELAVARSDLRIVGDF